MDPTPGLRQACAGGNPAIGWQADFTPSFTTKYVAFGKMLDVTNPPVILQINLKE